jgi:hypothetical protein
MTKSDWDTAAISWFSATAVCGCPLEPMSGKKLYRLVSFARSQTGAPPPTSAPTGPAQGTTANIFVYSDTTGVLSWQYAGNTLATLLILQCGQGLKNPQLTIPAGAPGSRAILSTEPAYPYLLALAQSQPADPLGPGAPLSECQWDSAYAPTGELVTAVYHFP